MKRATIVSLALVVVLGTTAAAVSQDTTRVDFKLGSSEVEQKYLSKLHLLGEILAAHKTTLDYKVIASVDSISWNKVKKNKSEVLNAALLVSRAYAAFKVMGLPLELSKVTFVPEQKERFVKIIVFKLSKDQFSKVESQVNFMKNDINYLKQKSSQSNWSLIIGWQGVNFGDDRNLSVPMGGLRFSWKGSFIQLLAGVNPWSFQGYRNYWYRDALGAGSIGYNFYKNSKWIVNYQMGGLIGWEYTSETNQFDLQILGISAGIGAEVQMARELFWGLSLNYVYAETSDMTPETGKMRSGIYGSVFVKIF